MAKIAAPLWLPRLLTSAEAESERTDAIERRDNRGLS